MNSILMAYATKHGSTQEVADAVPETVAVFGGVDPPRRHDEPRRDLRDWEAIRTWARQLNTIANRHHAEQS